MKQLRFEEQDKLADVLKVIQETQDKEIEIISTGSSVFELNLNRKVIEHAAETLAKKVSFKNKSKSQVPVPIVPPKQEGHGFVEGQDVADQAKATSENKENSEQKPTPEGDTTVITAKKKSWKERFKKLFKGPKWVYAVIGGFLVLITAGILSFWLIPSADIVLFTKAQFQEAEFPLTASENVDAADKEQSIIPLQVLETTEEDTLEVSATGKKTVGERANGRVTIVNRDSENEKTFFKGTVIVTNSGPKISFTLNDAASLPKADAGCTDDCPETGVDVTAQAIGDSGNLEAGTVFKVGDADVDKVFAKNETNFSGGSSKEVTVVSQEDQEKARKDLLAKLEEAGQNSIETENPQVNIPENGLKSEITREEFTQKVSDEVENFGISMTVKFSAKAFSENDLKEILIGQITDNVPNDFVLDSEGAFVTSEILQEGDSEISILGKIRAPLLPNLDQDEIKRNVSGKDFGTVDGYLKSLNSVSGFEIMVHPAPFRFFGIMPFMQSKISLEIRQEE